MLAPLSALFLLVRVFYFRATLPAQIGVLVGCALPPSGSSVMASTFVPFGKSGGVAISSSNFPSAFGRRVKEGTALAPGTFGISRNKAESGASIVWATTKIAV